MVLLSTHNIWYGWEIRKSFFVMHSKFCQGTPGVSSKRLEDIYRIRKGSNLHPLYSRTILSISKLITLLHHKLKICWSFKVEVLIYRNLKPYLSCILSLLTACQNCFSIIWNRNSVLKYGKNLLQHFFLKFDVYALRNPYIVLLCHAPVICILAAPPPRGMGGIVTLNFSEPWYKLRPVGTSLMVTTLLLAPPYTTENLYTAITKTRQSKSTCPAP